MNWIKNHLFGLIMFGIIFLFIGYTVAEIIHYNLEPEHKIYVEYIVYDHGNTRQYHETYNIVGDNFQVQDYWQSAGKHSGSYRVVRIIDGNAWNSYINKQSVCIYTGMNDVEVKKIQIIK